MKWFIASIVLLFATAGFYACNKSVDSPAPPAPDTTIVTPPPPPPSPGFTYTYDSSFKSTGNFATMGALQPDGKIIIANKTQIARLNQDGTRDNGFATGSTANGEFHCLALQKDGKILLGGSFTSYNGQNKAYYIRLNGDGSIDNSFTTLPLTFVGAQSDIDVRSLAIQADGKILVGGNFYHMVSSDASGFHEGQRQIIRVTGSGTYDASFQHRVSADYVNCMRVLPDGKILVTGQKLVARIQATETTPEANHNYIAKLDSDGSVEPSFKWRTTVFGTRSPYTYLPAYGQDIALLDGGKLLLSGRFQTTSRTLSEDYNALVRLNPDGSIDNTLPKRTYDGIVSPICMASDKIVLGRMHDPDRNYQTANVAIDMINKDGTDNETFKVGNFTGYGDTYMVLEDAGKNLLLIGKLYDQMPISVTSFHGIIRLKRL